MALYSFKPLTTRGQTTILELTNKQERGAVMSNQEKETDTQVTKKGIIFVVGMILASIAILAGVFYLAGQHSKEDDAGPAIYNLTATEALEMGDASTYQKIDFRPASEYNEEHIDGFINREPVDLDTSDQLYEAKVMAVINDETPVEHINENLPYLGIERIIYINGFSDYLGDTESLLGSCGADGVGCGSDFSTAQSLETVQYAQYLGDGLFFALGGKFNAYTGPVIVGSEDDVLVNAEVGEFYRFKHNGIMAMSYPGRIGGEDGLQITTPAVWEAPSTILDNQQAFEEFGVGFIEVDSSTYNGDTATEELVNKDDLYIISGTDRLLIERVALDLLDKGYTRIIKTVEQVDMSLEDEDNPEAGRPLTVLDASELLTLGDNNDQVHFWDVRNQGYDDGHIQGFSEMTQEDIQNKVFTDEEKLELYIIHCKTGGVTAEVVDILASKGVHNVIDLGGLVGQDVNLVQ